MLFRLILGMLVTWLVLTVVRSALGTAAPRDSRHRDRVGRAGADQRRRALATLGLYDGATAVEIKKAYKELASKYHPDRVAHLGPELVELTSEKFKEVKSAYEFLDGP